MTSPATPDRRAWLMWGLPTFLFLIAFFHRAAPGVFAKELMHAFAISGAVVGLLSGTYFYAYAGLMIPAGVLLDAFGVRRVVTAGGAVMAGGTLLMAVAGSQGMLFAGRLLVGAGAAVTFVGALKIAATWFPASYFGTLSAVTATAGVLGALVATVPLAWLATTFDWRGALVLVGLATLAAVVLCGALVRDHPSTRDGGGPPAPSLAGVLAGLRTVLANGRTWPPFLAFFFGISATQNLLLWAVPYLRDVYGLSMMDAALYATAPSLAVMLSGPLTGYLSDRVLHRRKLPYTVLTAVQSLCWLAFVGTLGRLPLGGVYTLFFLMGLAGSWFVLTWPLGREVNPPELAGVSVAAVNLGGFLGIAVTQGPFGALLDARWAGTMVGGARVYPVEAYRMAFVACTLLVMTACAISLFLTETRGRNIWTPRA